MDGEKILKRDLFGEVRVRTVAGESVIVRDTGKARWWLRWLARRLMAREARALAALEGIVGVPAIRRYEGDTLEREYLDGLPLHQAKPTDATWFADAGRLLRRLHRGGVIHNDLAKEPNLLVRADGAPALIDFQLAWHARKRTRLFRIAAYEDIRHLLKHKRTYCPGALTSRERRILANPSPVSRLYMRTIKPLYLLVTRRILGWSDREGAGDRGARG